MTSLGNRNPLIMYDFQFNIAGHFKLPAHIKNNLKTISLYSNGPQFYVYQSKILLCN